MVCDVRACMYSTLFRFMAYVSCHDGASYHCMKKLKYVHARMHACMHVYAGRDVMHGYLTAVLIYINYLYINLI